MKTDIRRYFRKITKFKDLLQIAEKYAKKIWNDTVREADEKNAWHYYHIFRQADKGHKLGMPQIVKINEMGRYVIVSKISEIMWAVKQEVLLNNLGSVF